LPAQSLLLRLYGGALDNSFRLTPCDGVGTMALAILDVHLTGLRSGDHRFSVVSLMDCVGYRKNSCRNQKS
jgi:hypothetical protein